MKEIVRKLRLFHLGLLNRLISLKDFCDGPSSNKNAPAVNIYDQIFSMRIDLYHGLFWSDTTNVVLKNDFQDFIKHFIDDGSLSGSLCLLLQEIFHRNKKHLDNYRVTYWDRSPKDWSEGKVGCGLSFWIKKKMRLLMSKNVDTAYLVMGIGPKNGPPGKSKS